MARERLLGELEEQVRATLLQHALETAMVPPGVPGHIEAAFKIDRRKIVVEKLRDVATTLEKGYAR